MTSMRLAQLSQFNKKIFRTDELKLIWGINSSSNFSTIIYRFKKAKILFRIIRGLYSTASISSLNKYELATAVAGSYSYISTESVLFDNGIIMQSPEYITVVGLRNREYDFDNIKIKVRTLSPKYLHNRLGVSIANGYCVATSSRAVADILHYNPNYYFDNLFSVSKTEMNKFIKEIYTNGTTLK
jgi:hypothetical protein